MKGDLSGSREDSSSSSSCAALAQVRHLPPLQLHLDIPAGYPEEAPPNAQLICDWLSPSQIAALQQQLDRLWQEQGPGLPVGFVWIDWLQNEALPFLGLQGGLLLSGSEGQRELDGSPAVRQSSSASSLSPSAPAWVPGSPSNHKQNGKLEGELSKGKSAAVDQDSEGACRTGHSSASTSELDTLVSPRAQVSEGAHDGGMDSRMPLVAQLVSYSAMRDVEIFKEVQACLEVLSVSVKFACAL